MALSSMTGFAQSSGEKDGLHWQWEIKSVNGKALDIRFRLPPGFDGLEAAARASLSQHIKRGNLQVVLTTSGTIAADMVVVNEAVLEQVLDIAQKLRDRIGGMPLNAEALMGLRGVLEVVQPIQSEAEAESRLGDVRQSLQWVNCHVWTAPLWQAASSLMQSGRVRSCVRPVGAAHDRWP